MSHPTPPPGGPYPPAPGGSYPYPPPGSGPKPARKRRRWLHWVGYPAAVLIGLSIGLSAGGTKTAANSGAAPAATVTVTAPTGTPATTPATTKPPAPAKPTTLLTFKGSGIKNSKKFTTGDDWTIHWSYNCSGFGSRGNFIVDIYDGNSPSFTSGGVNELGAKGSDTSPVYGDPGEHYLSVNSECSWTITVTSP